MPVATLRGTWLGAVAAAVLCGVGAELLSGYGPSTGHVSQVLLGLAFFAGLYGAPAVLAREVARRNEWGWPSLLFVYAGLGVAQCCLIDQSLFSADYQGYEGWEQAREGTWVPWLGVSAYNALTFVLGHVIFSFGAPIAVAEAWRPAFAMRPWLGRAGVTVAVLAYGVTVAMIVGDPASRSANGVQIAVSSLVVASLVGAAVWIGTWRSVTPRDQRATTRVAVVVLVAMALAAVAESIPPTWTGVTVYAIVAGLGTWLLSRRSATSSWTVRHAAAVGVGVLLARGLLAFIGDPVGGEVDATFKYAHNAAMLVVVIVAAWCALRPRTSAAA